MIVLKKILTFAPNCGATRIIPIKFHTFNSGEEHVTLDTESLECSGNVSLECSGNVSFEIRVRLDNSAELIKLLLVTDAVRRTFGDYKINLIMPYIPYARQDRACVNGDAFSLKVFANIINSQNYNKVIVADAHSMVSTALINNVEEITQDQIVSDTIFIKYKPYDFIIAPDAGESKKAEAIVKGLSNYDVELIQALKVRNKQGQIVSTKILCDDLQNKSCLIVDDICAAGGTFKALAKVLKEKNAGEIGLYVTHGVFDHGVETLLSDGIDQIYTTDSLDIKDNRVNIIKNFF
jgi:ribose-phosphate pyrophosphokinase